MTAQENIELKKYLSNLSAYYQRQLPDMVLQMYAADLNDLRFDDVMKAMSDYRMGEKNRTMPIPAQIRAMLERHSDPHDVGVLVAAKVTQAVSKFGWTNPQEAMNFIGPLGQQAVRVFGGWDYICKNLGVTIDITTFQAQVREITKSEARVSPPAQDTFKLGSGGLQKANPLSLIGKPEGANGQG